MGFSRITGTFDNPDSTAMSGTLIAIIPVDLKTAEGIFVPEGQHEFPLVNGVPFADGQGVNPAKLPATATCTPANIPVELRIQPTNGNSIHVGKFVIPEESGGAPVALNSLADVS